MKEAKIGDVVNIKRTNLYLTVVPDEEYDPFADDGKVNVFEANSHMRMCETTLFKNTCPEHPKNFEKRVYGKQVKGLIHPNGKIDAILVVNASHSGRDNYTFENIHTVKNANVLDCVKIAVETAFSEQYQPVVV